MNEETESFSRVPKEHESPSERAAREAEERLQQMPASTDAKLPDMSGGPWAKKRRLDDNPFVEPPTDAQAINETLGVPGELWPPLKLQADATQPSNYTDSPVVSAEGPDDDGEWGGKPEGNKYDSMKGKN